MGDVCPIFKKCFSLCKNVIKAELKISSRGIYFAEINGKKICENVLNPGWTQYEKRVQFQTYDVTNLLSENNEINVTLSDGWYLGRVATAFCKFPIPNSDDDRAAAYIRESAIIAELCITYDDQTTETVSTDESWQVGEGQLRFSDIFDGEIYDATFSPIFEHTAKISANNDLSVLIPQQGELIVENERVKPIALITTPKGEKVLDFGQNLAGYPEITVTAKEGEVVDLAFAEILDVDGNFYNENYRSAKCYYKYVCKDGEQTHKPTHTYYGFRYIRINEYPECPIELDNFTAIVVHSDLERTGYINSSDEMLNKLFGNVIWGQKSNYLDIPTDCPQRDERLGWTGDAEIFMKTACYNFNVKRFFTKWLDDMMAVQELHVNGAIPSIVPSPTFTNNGGAAWGDAATVCPWELYLNYGDKELLRHHFPMMKKWVDSVPKYTTKPDLWISGSHYGDWLELTGEYGASKGQTRDNIIGSGFYAYSTSLVIKAAEILGEDASEYVDLYNRIVKAFKNEFNDDFKTQTECIVALHFGLCIDENKVIDKLVSMIEEKGKMMQTGFVGTPYILHVLTKYGYSELAYDLLLRKEYPSWLYPITMGATTMWEHWDGIRPDGKLWPATMNSYNHYAYGAVCDWIYSVACGINPIASKSGFEEVLIKPIATDKIDRLSATLKTKYGVINSGWHHRDGKVVYEIETPVCGVAVIEGKEYKLLPGKYMF